MPGDLPIAGNGRLLVNFDGNYCVRDIYYPRIGKENQTLGEKCRHTVIWINGSFSWLHEEGWKRSLNYLPDTLVTDAVKLQNDWLRVRIEANDAVHPDHTIFLRHFVVYNDADEEREVRLFFHYDFNILENSFGDTAYLRPDRQAVVVQYKGMRYFLMNARNAEAARAFFNIRPGIKKIRAILKERGGKTPRTGKLGGNSDHAGSRSGRDDFGPRSNSRARASAQFEHWVWCAEKTFFNAADLNALVLRERVP